MICQICGKEFKSKGLGAHLKTHNISVEDYYREFFMKENEDKCIICGKPTTFINTTLGYFKHCSPSCAVKDKETQQKMINTSIKRYGVEHPLQNKDIVKQMKQNNIKKYGVDSYMKTEAGRQMAINNFTSEKANLKRKQTNLKKYGVENPYQAKEIREKIKQTNLERYGVENPYQQSHVKEKAKLNSNSEEAIKKRKHTFRKNIKINSEKMHLRRIHNKNAKYKYNYISFDSKLEYDVYMYCVNNDIPIEREPIQILFENDQYATYPDFSIDGILVEIKGNQFIDKDGSWIDPWNKKSEYQEKRRQAMLSHNVKIWTIYEVNEFINGNHKILYE